jgi:putative transposase
VQFPNSFRCSSDEWPWKTAFGGQKRIQAELARLGFKVSARTVAKYMLTARRDRGPSVRWRTFLKLHASNIWACDFFCVQTLLFDTLHVFFVIQHINREVLHVAVTRHPTAEWLAQQILESCAWDRRPPRFIIHDRDSRYGPSFDRRLKRIGIKQVRTPFRCPVANAVAERWVKSARTECLDHLFVLNELTLRRAISSYVAYYNHHRPHRSPNRTALQSNYYTTTQKTATPLGGRTGKVPPTLSRLE